MEDFKFDRPIFFGSPNSIKEVEKLHNAINYACAIIGGLQQPDHPISEEHAKKCKEDNEYYEKKLQDTIKNIRIALGDKEISNV